MFWKKIFSTFLISLSYLLATVEAQRVVVDSNLTVDYVLTYESDAIPQKSHHNLRFQTIYYDSPAFITFHDSLDECYTHCATLELCAGIYQEWNQSLLMTIIDNTYMSSTVMSSTYKLSNVSDNTNSKVDESKVDESKVTKGSMYCYLLSDLGLGYDEVNVTSNSYTKIQHHNFTKHLGNNSISVVILESSPINQFGNSTTYLDLNHNGVLDDMEPNISTKSGVEVVFHNLSAGRYLVRTDPPNFCHQLFPGMRGDNYYFMIPGDGYIDTINTYYHQAHSSFVTPHGGYIDTPGVVANKNFSFILGDDNNTYLSFYPENNITVGFVDETIVNVIVIEVYGESSTHAHVSVSHDNIDFYPIGILESKTTIFNLTKSGFNLPVAFVKLFFMGNDPYIPLNIIRIYSPLDYLRTPEFGFLIGLPNVNPQYSYYNYVLFYHDCYNKDSCESYCYYMSNNFNREESCLTGCNIFYETESCECQNWQNINSIEYYGDGDEFDMEWCYKGCHYELGWTVGPEFIPLVNHTGLSKAIIPNEDMCSKYCLVDLYDTCLNNAECNSFSYDLQTQGQLYGDWLYRDSPGDLIMLRRENFSIFTELTTTSTTSLTTTSSSSSKTSSTSTTSSTLTSSSKTSSSKTLSTLTSSSTSITSSTLTSSTKTSSTSITSSTLTSSSKTSSSKTSSSKTSFTLTTSSSKTSSYKTTSSLSSLPLTNASTSTGSYTNSTTSNINGSFSNTNSSSFYINASSSSTNSTLVTQYLPITETSTFTSTFTDTDKINDEGTGSGLETSTSSSNNQGSNSMSMRSSNSKDNTVLSVLVSLFVVILLGFGIIGYVIYKRRTSLVPRNENNNNEIIGFDNPIYNHQNDNNNTSNYVNYPVPENQEVLYQDTDEYQPDANYLEIQE